VPTGVVDQVAVALAVWCGVVWRGLARRHQARWVNHRYWFTTWRWGGPVAAFLLMAWVIKFMALA